MSQHPTHKSIFLRNGRIGMPKPADGGQSDKPIQTVDQLATHLQTALAVELSTIPLYLTGMFTVKNNPDVVKQIRGVVNEEMLHLCLAGNALRGIGRQPILYDSSVIPEYPTCMLGRVPELMLQLRRLTKPNVDTFVAVETPEPQNAQPEPGEYHTLGQFYAAVELGFNYLVQTTPNLFDSGSEAFQFPPDSVFRPPVRDAGGIVQVVSYDSAIQALRTIVLQGSWAIFSDLRDGSATWDVYPTATNQTTEGYRNAGAGIYQVSLAFDSAYCLLLLTIRTLWSLSADDKRNTLISKNMFPIMKDVLPPLATFLMQQPIGDEVAAPAFNYYRFDSYSTATKQVQRELQAAVDAYAGNTSAQDDLKKIQIIVNALVDVISF